MFLRPVGVEISQQIYYKSITFLGNSEISNYMDVSIQGYCKGSIGINSQGRFKWKGKWDLHSLIRIILNNCFKKKNIHIIQY